LTRRIMVTCPSSCGESQETTREGKSLRLTHATSSAFLGGVLGWDMGGLPVGDSGEIHVRVHVAAVAPEGDMVLAVVRSDASRTVNVSSKWAPCSREKGAHAIGASKANSIEQEASTMLAILLHQG
jgi:hypothetical protein